MRVLWLRPTTGDNISVGRELIAKHLESAGMTVDIHDASGFDAIRSVINAIRGEYDVIVGTTRIGLYIGYPLSRLLRTGFIADVADPIRQIQTLPYPVYAFFHWYEHEVLTRAPETVFVYSTSYEEAQRHGVNGVKLNNGVDYERFSHPDESIVDTAGGILREAGVTLDEPIAIYIGGFNPIYNLDAILSASTSCPDWQFVFIGEGELAQDVETAAARNENVFYPGAFDHSLIPGFLSHANAGFCLVDAEQPLKVLEYGAAGLPTIAIKGELANRFSDEELAFVSPDADAIADELARFASDHSYAERLSQNLQQRAEEQRWSAIARKYETLIQRVTA